MKRLTYVLVATAAAALLVSCGSADQPETAPNATATAATKP